MFSFGSFSIVVLLSLTPPLYLSHFQWSIHKTCITEINHTLFYNCLLWPPVIRFGKESQMTDDWYQWHLQYVITHTAQKRRLLLLDIMLLTNAIQYIQYGKCVTPSTVVSNLAPMLATLWLDVLLVICHCSLRSWFNAVHLST